MTIRSSFYSCNNFIYAKNFYIFILENYLHQMLHIPHNNPQAANYTKSEYNAKRNYIKKDILS